MTARRKNPNCPCTSKCSLHGDCIECRAAHRASATQTSCEKLGIAAPREEPADFGIRLLDFTPCAG